MVKENKLSYYDLIDVVKKSNNSFSRENIFGKLKDNLGDGFFIWNDLGNGIACASSNYKLVQDLDIFLDSKINGAVLIFNLGNEIRYEYKDKKTFTLQKNHFVIGFSTDDFYADIKLKKQCHYNTLTIGIKEELFLQLADNLEIMKEKMKSARTSSYALLDGGNIDPEQFEILSAFNEESLNENLLNNLFLESKVTSLTHYTIEKILKDMSKSLSIDESILKSLRKAKQIILDDYASSLSIKEIAYKSAINECYLKKEFKLYYGMTVYEMLQKQRLETAKQFLKDGVSVKQTALKVGYKHSGHFSKLFCEHYGLTPSVYRKQFN